MDKNKNTIVQEYYILLFLKKFQDLFDITIIFCI